MNAQLSIPTGNARVPFDNIQLTEAEMLVIEKHPRLKEATSVSIFSEKADDIAQVEAIVSVLNARVEFKGDIRRQVTRSGATLFQLVRRPSVSASRLFAALCEGKS